MPGAVLTVSRGTGGTPVYAAEQAVVADATGTVSWTVSPRRTSVHRVESAGDAPGAAARLAAGCAGLCIGAIITALVAG